MALSRNKTLRRRGGVAAFSCDSRTRVARFRTNVHLIEKMVERGIAVISQPPRPALKRGKRLRRVRSGGYADRFTGREAVATEREHNHASQGRSRSRRGAEHKAGCCRDLHRCGLPGSSYHPRGTLSSWRFGRYVHARRPHRLALPPGWTDALLFVRRWPHLLQGREAPSAEQTEEDRKSTRRIPVTVKTRMPS